MRTQVQIPRTQVKSFAEHTPIVLGRKIHKERKGKRKGKEKKKEKRWRTIEEGV